MLIQLIYKYSQRVILKIFLKMCFWSSRHGSAETNPTRNHEVEGSLPSLAHWLKDPALLSAVVQVTDMAWILFCCGYTCVVQDGSCSADLTSSWEPPYSMGVALKKKKRPKKCVSVSFCIFDSVFLMHIFNFIPLIKVHGHYFSLWNVAVFHLLGPV